MLGENADWIPGQDHAAIATEAVLVRELAKVDLTREKLGRVEYLRRAWAWRDQYGGEINEAFQKLGFGPDWSRERFTMDPGLSAAVAKVFVALYREGLIYRGTRLVNWDPVSQSTLSDAEVDDEERDGFLWHVRYPSEDGSFSIEGATTRPETMLGDTAVAVHPDDDRYRALVGKYVVLPLVGRKLPIVADAAVEREFGTGAIKVTPAHDPLDNEIGERHQLPMPSVIGIDGKMTAEVPEAYQNLDRFDARKAVVRDLEKQGLIVKTEPRRHTVPVSSRSGAVVEPRRPHPLRPRTFRPDLRSVAREHSRLERFAPGLVGPPASGVVRPEGRNDRRRERRRSLRARPARARHHATHARTRYARHLVFQRTLAVLDSRLAREDARIRTLVSQSGHGHEPRHHLLVGRADGDARHEVRRRHPV